MAVALPSPMPALRSQAIDASDLLVLALFFSEAAVTRTEKRFLEVWMAKLPQTTSILQELHELLPDEALAERDAVQRLVVAVASEIAAEIHETESKNRAAVASALGAIFKDAP